MPESRRLVAAALLAVLSVVLFASGAFATSAQPCEALFEAEPSGSVPTKSPAEIKLLVDNHYKLMLWLMNRFLPTAKRLGLQEADLVSAGHQGLMRAAQGFDPNFGVKFSSYARRVIVNEFIRAVDEAKKDVKLTESLDEPRGHRDDDDGVSLYNSVPDTDWEAKSADQKLEKAQADAAFALKAYRFKKGLSHQERIVFENAFVPGSDGSTKTYTEVAGLLGVSRERAGQIARSLIPGIKEYFSQQSSGGSMAGMADRVGYFRPGLGREELLVLDHRLLSEAPMSLEKAATRLGLLPAAIKAIENRLLARALLHEKALEAFEAGLDKDDLTILREQVLSDSRPAPHETGEKIGKSHWTVSRRALALQKALEQYLPVLLELTGEKKALTASAVQERLALKGVDVSLREIAAQLGLSPYGGYPKAVAYYRSRLSARMRVVFDEGVVAARPRTHAELADLTGYSLKSAENRVVDMSRDFAAVAPVLEALLARAGSLTMHGMYQELGALARQRTDLDVEQVRRAILYQPFRWLDEAVELFRRSRASEEATLLAAYIIKTSTSPARLAVRFGKTPDELDSAVCSLLGKMELYLPVIQELIDRGVVPTATAVRQSLENNGVHLSLTEISSELALQLPETPPRQQEFADADPRAIAYLRKRLPVLYTAVLDEHILDRSVAPRDRVTVKFGVDSGYVERIRDRLEKMLVKYLPVMTALLSERKKLTNEGISRMLARKFGDARSPEEVQADLELKSDDPFRDYARPDYRPAVEAFAALLHPIKRKILFERLVGGVPRGRTELAKELGRPAEDLDVLEKRIRKLALLCLPEVVRLKAAGEAVTLENLSKALAAAGNRRVSPKLLGMRFGGLL